MVLTVTQRQGRISFFSHHVGEAGVRPTEWTPGWCWCSCVLPLRRRETRRRSRCKAKKENWLSSFLCLKQTELKDFVESVKKSLQVLHILLWLSVKTDNAVSVCTAWSYFPVMNLLTFAPPFLPPPHRHTLSSLLSGLFCIG